MSKIDKYESGFSEVLKLCESSKLKQNPEHLENHLIDTCISIQRCLVNQLTLCKSLHNISTTF